MKNIWDDTHRVTFQRAGETPVEKGMHLRIWEEQGSSKKPVYVCEFRQSDNWTNDQKAAMLSAFSSRQNHGGLDNIRCWEQQPNGVIQEVTFQPFGYTSRPDRYDMNEQEFDKAARYGVSRGIHRSFTTTEKEVSVERQRKEIGEALMSYEQRQQFEFDRAKSRLPDL